MDLFNSYRDMTFVQETPVYGFGPWVISKMHEDESTFDLVVDEWLTKYNKAIIDHVDNRSLVIQAGGWQGVYAFLLSNMFETVYTFEPHPVNFYCLTQNCQRPNIIKFQACLSNTVGSIMIEETIASGQHRIHTHNTEKFNLDTSGQFFSAQTLSVDSLNLPNCGFMMIDVENYEKFVLMGAKQTIEKYKPVICLEKSYIQKNNDFYVEFLNGLGYEIVEEFPCDIFFKSYG